MSTPTPRARRLLGRVEAALSAAGLSGPVLDHHEPWSPGTPTGHEEGLVLVAWNEGPSEARVRAALESIEPEHWMIEHTLGPRLMSALVLSASDQSPELLVTTLDLLKRVPRLGDEELRYRTVELEGEAARVLVGPGEHPIRRIEASILDPLRLAQASLALELTDVACRSRTAGVRRAGTHRSETVRRTPSSSARVCAVLAEVLSPTSATRAALSSTSTSRTTRSASAGR